MKNFKKSKTNTSKAKATKAKTSKAKTTKTKTSKTKTPKIFFKGKLCFCLFPNSFSLERNCLMAASKNPENITGQVLSSFLPRVSAILHLHLSVRLEIPFNFDVGFFTKVQFIC